MVSASYRHSPSTARSPFLVLATKKEEAPQKKGKGYKDAQGEAEVRKSLASKKAGGAALSKQDQALVQAQLEKEGVVRARVTAIKARLEQGLNLVHSLVRTQVEQLSAFVAPLAGLLRDGAFGPAVALVGETSFVTYLVRIPCNLRGRCKIDEMR